MKEEQDIELLGQYESTLDSVAMELIAYATDETKGKYYEFRAALQADLRAKFGDVFGNF